MIYISRFPPETQVGSVKTWLKEKLNEMNLVDLYSNSSLKISDPSRQDTELTENTVTLTEIGITSDTLLLLDQE